MSVKAYLQIKAPELSKDSSFSLSHNWELVEALLNLENSNDQRGDNGSGVVEFNKNEVREWLKSDEAKAFNEDDRASIAADLDKIRSDWLTYEVF